MMFLLQLLLLLLASAALDVAEPQQRQRQRTFTYTDPGSGRELVCDRCPPGAYLRARCTESRGSDCAPCPRGSYTEVWNHIDRCLRCDVCGQNQVVETPCAADGNCRCTCKQGYYSKYDMCLQHSQCPTGEGVRTQGTASEDTVCQVCANGTYSDVVSSLQSCKQHRSCEAAGLHCVLKGTKWHDSLCASCEKIKSKDGAEFLRHYVAAFFGHQRIVIWRLRQIVHQLPSAGGRKPGGAPPALSLSELYAKIGAWAATATTQQMQQLPSVLIKAGASSAGEKLQSRLQHINSHLKRLCALENEV